MSTEFLRAAARAAWPTPGVSRRKNMSKVTLLNSGWGATEPQPATPRHVVRCLGLTQAFRASRRKAGAGESACLSNTCSAFYRLRFTISYLW